jgi:UDP-glucose 4-epimerase
MSVLLTGGAGYIGSHTALALLEAGYDVIVYDNLSNASRESLRRVEKLTGKQIEFVEGDVRDRSKLAEVFDGYAIDSVIHFAGLKAVGESGAMPLKYYDNNVGGAISLCEAMEAAGVRTLVFSSSATVYSEEASSPLSEQSPVGRPTNPYGSSKLMIEWLLSDLQQANPAWSIASLRYFNPVGAHPSGQIGEDPVGVPNNLLPYITQVAVGRLPELQVHGNDYPTADGTGVRDYIHVLDLAQGHVAALAALKNNPSTYRTWNLGTGRGYSVLEMVQAFENASGRNIPYRIGERRTGDLAECWADVSQANEELGWHAERGIDDIMRDAWRWQEANPQGYGV